MGSTRIHLHVHMRTYEFCKIQNLQFVVLRKH